MGECGRSYRRPLASDSAGDYAARRHRTTIAGINHPMDVAGGIDRGIPEVNPNRAHIDTGTDGPFARGAEDGPNAAPAPRADAQHGPTGPARGRDRCDGTGGCAHLDHGERHEGVVIPLDDHCPRRSARHGCIGGAGRSSKGWSARENHSVRPEMKPAHPTLRIRGTPHAALWKSAVTALPYEHNICQKISVERPYPPIVSNIRRGFGSSDEYLTSYVKGQVSIALCPRLIWPERYSATIDRPSPL